MNKTQYKSTRGVIGMAALLVVGALGVGGVYVYNNTKDIKQLSANQQQMGGEIANLRGGMNVIHANNPELFKRTDASAVAYQAPTCTWMQTFSK